MRAAAAVGTSGFTSNEKLPFSVQAPPSGVVVEGQVFICVETVGVNRDMRLKEGMQSGGPEYPAIGLVVLPNHEGAVPADPAGGAVKLAPVAADGAWLECTLPANGKTHTVVPYLATGALPGSLGFCVTVYSSLPLGDAAPPPPPPPAAAGTAAVPVVVPVTGGATDVSSVWECEKNEAEHGPICPYRNIVEKMAKLEGLMDERLAFLDERLAAVN